MEWERRRRRYLYGKIDKVFESNDAYGTVAFKDHVTKQTVCLRGTWSEAIDTLAQLGGGIRVAVEDVGDTFRRKSLLRIVAADTEAIAATRQFEGHRRSGAQISKAMHALYAGLPPGPAGVQALCGLSAARVAERIRIAKVVAAATAQKVADAVKRVYTPEYAAFARRYDRLGPAQCYQLWEHAEAMPGGADVFVSAAPFRAAEVALGVHSFQKFADVDRLATDALGLARNAPERIRRHGVEVVRQMIRRDGHTHVSARVAIGKVGRSLGATPGSALDRQAQAVLADAWAHDAAPAYARANSMELGSDWGVTVEGDDCAYPQPHLRAEQSLTQMVGRLEADAALALAPSLPMDDFHPLQRAAVVTALARPISILTGSPGTGKTRVLVRIIVELLRAGHNVVACSFTGKASQRLAAVLAESPDFCEEHRARICFGKPCTIHKLVQSRGNPAAAAAAAADDDDDVAVDYNPGLPTAVVVDEASMVALQAMAALNAVVPRAVKWVVAGDAFQLPSIAPGRVLHDAIASGRIPTTTLTHVFRTLGSGGLICANALRVRGWIDADQQGTPEPEALAADAPYVQRGARLACNPGEFEITDRARTPSGRADAAVAWYERHGNAFLDCQVLCHMCKTCDVINPAVRNAVNPAGGGKRRLANGKGDHWHVGDRVMCTKNQYVAERIAAANGEMGTIVEIEWSADPIPAIGGESERVVAVRFDDGGRVVLFTTMRFNHIFVWGYAITVHKSQGSEWQHVMLHLDAPASLSLCSAHVTYTGFTRAQRSVTIEGEVATLNRALYKTGEVADRRSNFAQRLAQ